jgi:hypothetical protein
MSHCPCHGRLGNHIIKYISCSIICKKHNLYVDYNYKNYEKFLNQIEKLGILLFSGENKYENIINVTANNWYNIFDNPNINSNINLVSNDFFQKKIITDEIHKYLHDEEIMNHYINSNSYKKRFNNNNDCFIHIRLGDVSKYLNLDIIFKYYIYILNTINVDNIYISSDSPNHNKIKELLDLYSNSSTIHYNEHDTIHFASTCKYVILSQGTFSAIIGYLSYYSNVYYYIPDNNTQWDKGYSDLFTDKYSKIHKWNSIDISKI